MEFEENNDLQERLKNIRDRLIQRDPTTKDLIEETLKIAEEQQDKEAVGDLYVGMANYYALIKRDMNKSMSFSQKAKPFFDMKKPRRAGYFYGNLGINNHFFYRLQEAQDAYLRAIQYMEEIETLSEEETNRLATIYYNLYILFNNTELAILDRRYLDRALELYGRHDHKAGIIFCYGAIIKDLDKAGKVDEALDYALRRLEMADEIVDEIQIGFSCCNIGMLYAKKAERELSAKYLDRAKEYLFRRDVPQFKAGYFDEKAQAHMALGEYQEAIDNFRQALNLYGQLDSNLNLSKLFLMFSEACEKVGNYQEAFKYQRMYSQMLLDNFKIDKVLYMSAVQSDFERQQQERETTMLKQKNEEIRRYAAQLERSNEDLKQFAHAASHDLREPVRMIVSYSELLELNLKSQLTPEQREFFGYLKEGGKRINEMIAGILTFSKINNQDDLVKVDLNDVIRHVKENLKLNIADKHATIEWEKMPVIWGSRSLMLQLLQNLVSNGITYNQSEKPEVKISCAEQDGFYKITVSDNGLGIDDKFRGKVFDMFSRLHSREKYQGSGIGLAICKRIIERMGGIIKNQPANGGGTDFIFTVPIGDAID